VFSGSPYTGAIWRQGRRRGFRQNSKEAVKSNIAKMREESGLDMPDEVHYRLFRAPSLDMVPVKITVSLPKAVLEEADRKAGTYGFTRSGLLARAARAYER
jgi:hypothetical protein